MNTEPKPEPTIESALNQAGRVLRMRLPLDVKLTLVQRHLTTALRAHRGAGYLAKEFAEVQARPGVGGRLP